MSARLLSAPTELFKTTLDGRLVATDTTVTLVSTDQLLAPGLIIVDRQDGSGVDTFHKMEYITFTSINNKTLSGVTRGVAGTTAIDHSSGALVECFLNVTHWGDMLDFAGTDHFTTGTVKTLSHVPVITFTGVSGASGLKGNVSFVVGGSASIYAVSGASGYSYLKIQTGGGGGLKPFTIATGLLSGTNKSFPMIIEDAITIKSASVVLSSPMSGASLVLDINKNFTSIFTDQNTRLSILGGGTRASTASIGTMSFVPGDILTLDIDNIA